jgi:hypothetical protein
MAFQYLPGAGPSSSFDVVQPSFLVSWFSRCCSPTCPAAPLRLCFRTAAASPFSFVQAGEHGRSPRCRYGGDQHFHSIPSPGSCSPMEDSTSNFVISRCRLCLTTSQCIFFPSRRRCRFPILPLFSFQNALLCPCMPLRNFLLGPL